MSLIRNKPGRFRLDMYCCRLIVMLFIFVAIPSSHAVAQVFTNSGFITIPDVGTAFPYPSSINVSGVNGKISSLTVTLSGLSHTFVSDIDVLLVGPTGANVALMFGAGGISSVSNVNLNFSDAALTVIPFDTFTSGTYRPANYAPGDILDSPAPSSPYGSTLSVFNNTLPNGTWKLFVQDMSPSDAGTIANGWSLSITQTPEPSSITFLISMIVASIGVLVRHRWYPAISGHRKC